MIEKGELHLGIGGQGDRRRREGPREGQCEELKVLM